MTTTALLTGGTGFLGPHLVDALQRAGVRVRALVRGGAGELAALGAETVKGDVLDEASLDAAMTGCELVVHAAGLVSRDVDDTRVMMEVNVQGTRKVVEAAARASVRRVLHVSTSGTVAVGRAPTVFHEDDPPPLALIHRWPYYLSKLLAERAAHDAIRTTKGASTELVTVNPTLALGPGDKRGSSTLDVRRYLDRQIPVVPSGGLSFVDVRDIARGAVLALERGRPGERYLLSALNLTFTDFFRRLGEVSGVPGPLVPVALPAGVARLGVSMLERALKVVGATAPVSAVEADMASCFWYVDARKAQEELGFTTRDPQKTLLDTVRDLRGERVGARPVGAVA